MCTIAFALQPTPAIALLVAANRDETRSRPTRSAGVWRDEAGHQILSGRDLQDGGTWMGCADNGRVALLTNIRPSDAAPRTFARSRGELCANWLRGGSLATWRASHRGDDFGGCNVVLGTLAPSSDEPAWWFLRNQVGAPTESDGSPQTLDETGWLSRPLGPGTYVVSNDNLDTPWPKALAMKEAMRLATHALPTQGDACDAPAPETQQALLAALQDRQTYAPTEQAMGPFDHVELTALSACFVDWQARDYGTRSSSLLWATTSQFTMREWCYDAKGMPMVGGGAAQTLACLPTTPR